MSYDRWGDINLSSDPKKIGQLLVDIEKEKSFRATNNLEQIRILLRQHAKKDKAVKPVKKVALEPSLFEQPTQYVLDEEFRYARDASLTFFRNNITCKAGLFSSGYVCKHKPQHTTDQIPYHLFSWSYEDFVNRNKIKNLDFIVKMFQMDVIPECCETLKFRMDYQYLEQWLVRIFARETNIEFYWPARRMKRELEQNLDFLKLYQTLRDEIAVNTEEVQTKTSLLTTLVSDSRESDTTELKGLLKEQLNNYSAWLPIELRYQKNWYTSKFNQYKTKCNMEINAVKKEINDCAEEIEVSNNITKLSLLATETETQDFENRYNNLKAQFERELEDIEGDIALLKRDLQSNKDKRNLYEKEMIRFQEEIEDVELKKEKELNAPPPPPKKPIKKKGCGIDGGVKKQKRQKKK